MGSSKKSPANKKTKLRSKKTEPKKIESQKECPHYEVQIQEEPGVRNVQILIQVYDSLAENDFNILFSLIEEYNLIYSVKDVVEAKYLILEKMSLKELHYPKQGFLACVTIIEEFNKIYITYLKYYYKNKLIYFIGKQDKGLQEKAKLFLEPLEFIISELVDNAFIYPFERYLREHRELNEKLQAAPLLEKYDIVKKTDPDYVFNATIFFEAKLKNEERELVIGISNEANISQQTLDMINKRFDDPSLLPDIVEEDLFNNPFKETSGLGLSMVKTILDGMNGRIANQYDDEHGRFVVEFSVSLD